MYVFMYCIPFKFPTHAHTQNSRQGWLVSVTNVQRLRMARYKFTVPACKHRRFSKGFVQPQMYLHLPKHALLPASSVFTNILMSSTAALYSRLYHRLSPAMAFTGYLEVKFMKTGRKKRSWLLECLW
jgi:hypothetical protein